MAKPLLPAVRATRQASTPSKRKQVAELAAKGELYAPPEWMTKSQRAEWEYAIQHAPPHVLKMADRAVMTAFVVAADLHARCAQELAKVDLMQPGARGGGNRVHPLTHTMDKQTVVMTRCAAELGFTPVARVRISLGGGEAEKTGWDELAKAS